MNVGVARAHVDLARKLEELPEVAAAFGNGEISSRHASVASSSTVPGSTRPGSCLALSVI